MRPVRLQATTTHKLHLNVSFFLYPKEETTRRLPARAKCYITQGCILAMKRLN